MQQLGMVKVTNYINPLEGIAMVIVVTIDEHYLMGATVMLKQPYYLISFYPYNTRRVRFHYPHFPIKKTEI